MSTADKSMIRQCLFNSTLREIREIEDIDYSFIEASPDFKERIKSSIEATPRKRKLYPKKLIVALVAVISLCFLFVFAVSAQVRTKVVDFFVEVYESFTLLLVKDNGTEDNPDTIESIYEPSYLTENNYEKSKESVNRLYMSATWKKEGSTIEFSQSIIDDNYILSDTEALLISLTASVVYVWDHWILLCLSPHSYKPSPPYVLFVRSSTFPCKAEAALSLPV